MRFHITSRSARRRNRAAWQEVSLAAGFLAGRYFVGTSDLHYGYWPEGLSPQIRNLPRAQEIYSSLLLDHVPANARRVLDVGCGGGSIAASLIDRGHDVDCVSPSSALNDQTKTLLRDRANVFECRYEDFQNSGLYDAILFCESFQYVNMRQALAKTCSQLRSGGTLVISDVFRLPVANSPISGGHPIAEFREIASQFPLRLRTDQDITSYTAPTYTVIDDAFCQVLLPIWNEVEHALSTTHPIWSKCAGMLFRKHAARVRHKYFTHQQTAENFPRFKTYRVMCFERE
jgi:2-polyprenyl-3-methyl-5-hydroxy-6-metoxy-1,4-benzoquinol methylase